MSEELLIRCCAPTLASMKTGSMFSCPFASREEMTKELCQVNRRLRHKGVRALPLRFRENTGLVYVYRPGQLHRDIREKTACNLLRDRGYPCENAALCIRRLMDRIDRQQDFPHEVGLFLGYPPGDVDGFIHRKGEAKCTGCWKVYGDVAQAQKTFARFKKCTDTYVRHWANGSGIEKLTVSA